MALYRIVEGKVVPALDCVARRDVRVVPRGTLARIDPDARGGWPHLLRWWKQVLYYIAPAVAIYCELSPPPSRPCGGAPPPDTS